jgi:hypothetical protein
MKPKAGKARQKDQREEGCEKTGKDKVRDFPVGKEVRH